MSERSSQKEKDYFNLQSPSASSPLSSPGFSGADWNQRSGVSSRYQPRRGSTASSIGSIRGSLDIPLHGRLVASREYGQNAISTLLQPPIVRTGLLPHTSISSSHKAPTRADIPPVTLATIPLVEPSAFKPYLSQVGRLFESHERHEIEEQQSQVTRKDEAASRDDALAEEAEGRTQRPRLPSRQTSAASLSTLDSPHPQRRSSAGTRRQLAVAPLSTIPSVYYEENFHLENPRTFDIVSERSEVIRTPFSPSDGKKRTDGLFNGSAPPPRKALATNAILQEKLSWYLDTVEIHLISSISSASQSFFAALGSLKELHLEAANSVTKIKELREDLAKLDQEMAMGGLEIVNMKQRRENLRKLNNSVDQLRSVVTGASHCEELVESGDLETALDRIQALEDFTCGRPRPKTASNMNWLSEHSDQNICDLRRLKALEGFAGGMDQLRARAGKSYEVRFLEALLSDLRSHVGAVTNQTTLKRWASSTMRSRGHTTASSELAAYLHTDSDLRHNLSVTLHGLGRSRSLSIASVAFREAIMREMKNLIRQHLPSSSDDDVESVASVSTSRSRALTQQDKSARLARNLRALGPDDAEELLMKMYCGVGEALRRLQTQVKMLLDVTSAQALSPTSNGPRSPTRSPGLGSIDAAAGAIKSRTRSDSTPLQEELMQALDLSSLLGQAVDAAQSQITKILKVRAEQSSTLPLPYFLRYFSLNRLFADECEAVSGRSGASLKNVVNTHITGFISDMAKNEREQLERTMDTDVWTAKDFSEGDENVMSHVLEGMTKDPPRWLSQAYVWEDNVTARVNGAKLNGVAGEMNTKEQPRPAVIDEQKFVLVDSALAMLNGIARYETLVACIPSIASEVSKELVDYLRFFNSRSCQLVLGAGATRSTAALPNINTKHLALASQALSFVINLIPYIREFIRRRPAMNPEKLIEYDKTKRLLQDHQVSINEKLVDIMSGRATKHVRSMKSINYDGEGQKDAVGVATVSKHMETLAKETVVLQRTLGRYLPEIDVKMIMAPVFASYREQWGDAFRDAAVQTEKGRNRLLRDAEHFDSRLSKIDGSGDTGSYLVRLVKEKTVAATPAAAPSPPPPEPIPTSGPTPGRPAASAEEDLSAAVKEAPEEASAMGIAEDSSPTKPRSQRQDKEGSSDTSVA